MGKGNEGQQSLAPVEETLADLGTAPGTLEEEWRMSKVLASSRNLVPAAYQGKPEECMVAIQLAKRHDRDALWAMEAYAVVKGKPFLTARAARELIMGAPDFDHGAFREGINESDNGFIEAFVTTRRKPDGEAMTKTFSVEDAKQAGLWGSGDAWKKYPKEMLLNRTWTRTADLWRDRTSGASVMDPREAETFTVEQLPSDNLDDLTDRLEDVG